MLRKSLQWCSAQPCIYQTIQCMYLSLTIESSSQRGPEPCLSLCRAGRLVQAQLGTSCSCQSHTRAAVPSHGSLFPQLRLKGGINREKELVACTHQAPASTPTASHKALPHVRPLLPTAVTSDPYYSCKLEQGRKNGCAVSFFMRQDLLRTIGEINPSM